MAADLDCTVVGITPCPLRSSRPGCTSSSHSCALAPWFSPGQQSRPCMLAQGQTIQITFTQRTPHYGRFELRVCPLSDPSLLTEYNELSEDCLTANQLLLAPNSTQVPNRSRVRLKLQLRGSQQTLPEGRVAARQ